MKRKIIVGNWKTHPATLDEAKRIFASVRRVAGKLPKTHIIICPPSIYIAALSSRKGEQAVAMGAQNVFYEEQGHFTGEIGPGMMKDLGVSHIIVGHSERRAPLQSPGGFAGETDEVVSKKVKAILDAGIHPILCVGEMEHDSQGLYLETLKNQIKNSLAQIPRKMIDHLIVAYEPVWAIGAKEPMEPAMVHEMSIFIKKVISDIYGHDTAIAVPVLYGGAVNFRNAPDILTKGGVDGFLVGRESVNTPGFIELLKAIDPL